ncbi:MAG: hypothetical protein B7Y41_16575 [Hydrogenophilales bacterium 28-61-23]|nr:MAG: hypothetical protein B7Y41_16575 [Hydrogenophilales bacterium 28-61-23]
MRRLIALILLLIVPLQFSWSAAMGVHGHLGGDTRAVGVHAHEHDLHASADSEHDLALAGDADAGHNDDGHHVSHCHHVFSVVFMASGLMPGQSQPGTAPAHPAARFTSHTPLPQNPPPPARA